MPQDIIPEDVKQFILNHIDSIAQWEALLLLRANPGTSWSADIIAQRLYISKEEATLLLSHLTAQGLLTISDNLYRYQPQPAKLEETIKCGTDLYKRLLVPITHLIHSKPKSRIREFADAFRIRKDKD